MIDGTKAVLAEPARLLGREFIPKWQHLNRRDRQVLMPCHGTSSRWMARRETASLESALHAVPTCGSRRYESFTGVPCGVFACPTVCERCRLNTRVGIAAGAEMR